MEDVSLVLEGGGMRGVFTSGVLDAFMEENMYFPYIIGVSAGACNALSYLSRQSDRSRHINVTYASDPRYIDVKNIFKGKGMFNMDFLFREIADHLVPFDYEAFNQASERFVVPSTDCLTGQPVYFEKHETDKIIAAVQASSSLPLVGIPVELEDYTLLDGGIVDPIPLGKAMDDGYKKHVLILTRPKGYRKKPFRLKYTSKLLYRKYPNLVEALLNRHVVYNQTMDMIDRLEANGDIYVIRPQAHEQVKRAEKDPETLNALHQAGYDSGRNHVEKILAWRESSSLVKMR